ncbi:putative ATP-dependent transporter [Monocercomonoides exilis]|uniref:putative ATP-dependent transporter n=1 Tax=Monocercomonoides exilis TaxID=2049356 RepID=UPI003559B7D0|nr:putative ATP-dependent transporter [Monocercomonoides exilis]|eukprot:MONOS_5509.1-p1 / transcript=MONOS_5509.1 / gene=MONOS_5509 / organism=Monocercomonoides_exilis_PA203 / gene_product=ATP-dependent transporter / transcript_product=ATP-dependent transporter / location=Mono_scaffold00161:82576-84945(+) / protein_length=790 / sequence_SO=supercontig / SO=protein_coding / is_pseudo=false
MTNIRDILQGQSLENHISSVLKPKTLAPRHIRKREQRKKEEGPDPDEEKFQDPNSSTRLTYIPDLHDVVIVKPQHADRSNPDEIRISEFSMSFAGKVLLNNSSLFLQKGRRYGLIGRNGVGKSTLLRHIARGSFNLSNSPDILFIEQEVPGNEASPLEWVLAADQKRMELLKEEQRLLGLIESTPAAKEHDEVEKEEMQKIREKEKKAKGEIGDEENEEEKGEGEENENEEEDGEEKPSSSSSPSDFQQKKNKKAALLREAMKSKKHPMTVAAPSSLGAAISSAAAHALNEGDKDDEDEEEDAAGAKGKGDEEDNADEGAEKSRGKSASSSAGKRKARSKGGLLGMRRVAKLASGSDASSELAALYEKMADMKIETHESRARSILKGLGFTEEDMTRPSNLFSGGWRMRISLARALFREPTFLFLDEPTNHLDLPGSLFLEQYLKHYDRGLVLVSHDRYFLDKVCTDIIFFNNEKLTSYKGSYSQFEIVRKEQRTHQSKAYENQQKEIARIQRFIDVNIAKSEKLCNAAQSRQKILAKMEKIEKPDEDDYHVTFRFPELGSGIKSPFLTFENVNFGYVVKKNILENISLVIGLSSRVALVGTNGAGKSTLLKLMCRDLTESSGNIWIRPSLSTVRFSQHAVDEMPTKIDALNYLYESVQALTEFKPPKGQEKIRAHLASFGVTGQMAMQNLGTMSGGERMRVALAKMTLNRHPHLLLLDEPTNHLDIEAREALAQALKAFQGAVVMVTHDQHLITATCSEIWVVEDKKVTPFSGDFEQYKKHLTKKMGW